MSSNKSGERILIRKVAVLGAGVMGAQIAAHLVNANVEAILFDLPAKEGDKSAIANKAIANFTKLEPSPLSSKTKASYIQAANYEEHLPLLKDCDLIIEAISERMDWKKDLYNKVSPYVGPHCVFATNTSGLSIQSLAEAMPESIRNRFCGVHFFNPPRYMTLVELIPCTGTNAVYLDALETFLTTQLGKGVIRAKDTPNFIANRVGVFSILATMHHGDKQSLSFDLVDALTGPAIGRAKSATYRTADVVGLDTLSHVVKTMEETLKSDPWFPHYKTPEWMQKLIAAGAVGQKSGQGVFKKVGKEIQVLDPKTGSYAVGTGKPSDEIQTILKIKNPSEKFAALRASKIPEAQFLWGIFRDVFHYCAVHTQSIAETLRDVDLAIRWGFGWEQGPFEIWQAAGWGQVAAWIQDDISKGLAMANVPLPAWATSADRKQIHTSAGSFSPATNQMQARSSLAVYQRQPYPDPLLGETRTFGETVFENAGVRMWHMGDGPAILSFKSKMNAIGTEVLDGIIESVKIAEKSFPALVIWQPQGPFSFGANLQQVVDLLGQKAFDKADAMVKHFQDGTMAVKMSQVPVVGAVQGMALGGGCELAMHCTHVVAALETYMGLVEVGVGLLPAGGGCKEFAIRASREAKGGNSFPFLQSYFQNMAMAQVSKSAENAKELGYLKASDTIVFNPNEILHVAKKQALALAESGYRPPLMARDIPVAGKGGIATLKMMLVNMKEGGFISEYDFEIGASIATVVCGGEVDGGSLVTEQWLLDWERKLFCQLLRNQKTYDRIESMLKTGKPLRN